MKNYDALAGVHVSSTTFSSKLYFFFHLCLAVTYLDYNAILDTMIGIACPGVHIMNTSPLRGHVHVVTDSE